MTSTPTPQRTPCRCSTAAGFDVIESDQANEWPTASAASPARSTTCSPTPPPRRWSRADIWEINANESPGYQYSRFNYNLTDLFDGATPFAASDHNPEIVGIDTGDRVENIQILGINDFHGRITSNPTGDEAGAAVLAGAVKQLRAQNPDDGVRGRR